MEQQLNLLRMDIGNVLQALERISNQPEPLATWFSGIVALVAILVTGYISRLQIKQARELKEIEVRANVIGEARKDWANTLRDTVAKILSNSIMIVNAAKGNEAETVTKCISEIQLQFAYLQLLLDPNKESHSELLNAAYLYYVKMVEKNNNNPKTRNINLHEDLKRLEKIDIDDFSARNDFLSKVQILLDDNWLKVRGNV